MYFTHSRRARMSVASHTITAHVQAAETLRPLMHRRAGLKRCLLGLIGVAGLFLTQGAAAQFTSQRQDGFSRLCVYRGANGDRVARVGLAEPCPARAPGSAAARPEPIPSLARLHSQSVQGSRRICTYRVATRTYTRAIPVSSMCSYTP
jgi:hypothetical protein